MIGKATYSNLTKHSCTAVQAIFCIITEPIILLEKTERARKKSEPITHINSPWLKISLHFDIPLSQLLCSLFQCINGSR